MNGHQKQSWKSLDTEWKDYEGRWEKREGETHLCGLHSSPTGGAARKRSTIPKRQWEWWGQAFEHVAYLSAFGHPNGETWEPYHIFIDGNESTEMGTELKKKKRREDIRKNSKENQCQKEIITKTELGYSSVGKRLPNRWEPCVRSSAPKKTKNFWKWKRLNNKPSKLTVMETKGCNRQRQYYQQIKSCERWKVSVTFTNSITWG